MADLLSSWQAVTAAAVSAVFAIAALAYMLGTAFGLRQVIAWAKDEFYQGMGGLVLLSVILMGLALIDQMAVGVGSTITMPDPACPGTYTGSNGFINVTQIGLKYDAVSGVDDKPPYSSSFDYVFCFLLAKRDVLWIWQTALSGFNFLVGIATSYQWYLMPYQEGIAFQPLAGLFPINEFTNMLAIFAGAGLGSLWGQIIILSFVRDRLFFTLPIGIALRAFTFTRGAGAALVALVLGLYVVYPMLVLFEIPLVQQDEGQLSGQVPTLPQLLLGPVFNPSAYVDLVLNWGLTPVYYIAIVAIFLPVLNFTLAFTFMREFASLLGGTIDVSSLAKLL